MNTASLALCKELYELSGWNDPELDFVTHGHWPAYDAGYLLRKLPPHIAPGDGIVYRLEIAPQDFVYKDDKLQWCAVYRAQDAIDGPIYTTVADTPEDCAAKLAIELFHQGVLKR